MSDKNLQISKRFLLENVGSPIFFIFLAAQKKHAMSSSHSLQWYIADFICCDSFSPLISMLLSFPCFNPFILLYYTIPKNKRKQNLNKRENWTILCIMQPINGLPQDREGRRATNEKFDIFSFQMSISPPLGLHFESNSHPWGKLIGTVTTVFIAALSISR